MIFNRFFYGDRLVFSLDVSSTVEYVLNLCLFSGCVAVFITIIVVSR